MKGILPLIFILFPALILVIGGTGTVGTPDHQALPYSSSTSSSTSFVFLSSTFNGQNQVLSVFSGEQGMMIYSNVKISLFSSHTENYSISVNGNIANKGNISGESSYSLQASGSNINIDVFIGNTSFTFNNEVVLHQAIQKYYGPKPPPLTATFLDEIMAALKGVFALFPTFIFGYFSLKPVIVNRKNRTPVVW